MTLRETLSRIKPVAAAPPAPVQRFVPWSEPVEAAEPLTEGQRRRAGVRALQTIQKPEPRWGSVHVNGG